MAGKSVNAPRQLSGLKLGHLVKRQAKLELLAVRNLTKPAQRGVEMNGRLALSKVDFNGKGACDRPIDRAQTTQSAKANIFAQGLDDPVLALRIEPYGQVATNSRRLPALLQHNSMMLPNPTVLVNKIPRL